MNEIVIGLSLLGSYLLGGIPVGPLAARVFGVDLRSTGSGNIGATNVYRAMGPKWAAAVFLGDAAKGLLAVLVSGWLTGSPAPAALGGLAAALCHVFNPFLRFKGGKGVATAFGAMLVISPLAALGSLMVWGASLWWKKIVSLASLAAAGTLPFFTLAANWGGDAVVVRTLSAFLLFGLVLFSHRANLGRLVRGEEPRIKRSGSGGG